MQAFDHLSCLQLLQQNMTSLAIVLQVIFDEELTVNERISDLISLAGQISATLDVNDETTFKENVNDINRRLDVVTVAARHHEMSLLNSIDMWNDFQVCRPQLPRPIFMIFVSLLSTFIFQFCERMNYVREAFLNHTYCHPLAY